MASLAAEPIYAEPVPDWARLSDAAVALRLRRDHDVPWWAIELLDLRRGSDEWRVRKLSRYGRVRLPRMWNVLADLVQHAEASVMQQPIERWRDLCYDHTDHLTGEADDVATLVRGAALRSPRAFVSLCDLRDDELLPITLKDFHLEMLSAMRRTSRPAMVQAFWGGGKSWISSLLVPLMDWAEWPAATEGRIYLDEDLCKKWTGKLMQIVEDNESLHKVFPWIAKPERGDPGHKIWGFEGFAIKGNPIRQRSFEPHTIGSSKTGFRFNRIGIDDVVNDKQARTPSIQDRNLDYIKSVVLTMRQRLRGEMRKRTEYGTVFPGVYTVGTPYDRVDVNVRLEQEYRTKGWRVVRVPIFVGHDRRPRWPEVCTPQYLTLLRDEMGPRAFAMRCELKVGGLQQSQFPEELVDWALKDGRADQERASWCHVPEHTKLIIGFDPGSGRRPAHHGARYPAFVVYGLRDLTWWRPSVPSASELLRDGGYAPAPPDLSHHVIQWGRLEGLGFHSQCQRLADLARAYACPVAVEDNGIQQAFADQIRQLAPDVLVLCHTTNANKRDPVQGVDQFEPILRNRRLVIHADEAPPDVVKALRDELVGWPTWAFTDLVMALWIARHQFSLHIQVSQPTQVRATPVPDYVRRFQSPIPERFTSLTFSR